MNGIFDLIGAGPQSVDFGRYQALSDFDIIVPRQVVPVAPGAASTATFNVKISTSWAYVWAGLRAQWSHSNFLIQLYDPSGRAMQSEPAAGPLVLIGLIGRPLGLMMPIAPGADLSGRIVNLDTVLPLTLDLAFLGFKASPLS